MDTELPAGGTWYDDLTSDMGTQTLWVALAEKAYAEANALGYVTTTVDGMDSYDAMNNGDPSWALPAITGKPASDLQHQPHQPRRPTGTRATSSCSAPAHRPAPRSWLTTATPSSATTRRRRTV